MGRPTKYTKKLGEQICERLAEGESLRRICLDEDMPSKTNVFKWLLSDSDVYKGFRDQYAHAREIQYQCMADEILDIADESHGDFDINEDGKPYFKAEAVRRSALMVDTRKWFMSKCLPKFADKPVQTNDDVPTPVQIVVTVEDARKSSAQD